MPTPLNQKPATAAWIVRERKRLKLKPRDLVERLGAQGLVVSEATVKVWESNADRRPAPENLEGLERIFESSAPGADAQSGNQSDVAAAIDRQTAMLKSVLDAILERLPLGPPPAVLAGIQAAEFSQAHPESDSPHQTPDPENPGAGKSKARRRARSAG